MPKSVPLNEHQRALLDELYSLYQSDVLTDVVIATDDIEIPCHRVVLAASSPYFRYVYKMLPYYNESLKTLESYSKLSYNHLSFMILIKKCVPSSLDSLFGELLLEVGVPLIININQKMDSLSMYKSTGVKWTT